MALEPFPLGLKRFAGGILLSRKEGIAERSGATVKIPDAAGQKNVPARRVRVWRTKSLQSQRKRLYPITRTRAAIKPPA
ncbi:MAG TPA: hypothetical protein DD982_21110 [Thalassospira sp.]|nr:hypothetical protein [Thalassospira sp.]MBA06015.1 hypothetical protein [Thalassospira sp.]OHZ02258.1 hypothetical protein BC440_15075 [Thalassospira sp. MIT1004]HBS25025.1 hypothetical protein [Thalassospira sp.]